MALDLVLVERRARRAYELGRLRRALTLSTPLLGLVAAALLLGPGRAFDLVVAGALLLTGVGYLWRGTLAERALLPGIGAGSFPLVLALLANGPGPGCAHGGALSLCAAACAVGGVFAALRVSEFARGEARSPAAFGLAMVPTFLLGSLGCGCIGFTGVAAMAGALLFASVPEVLRWTQRAA